MIVRTNMNSMYSNRQLGKNNSQVAKAVEKLASGYAINKAADDASGLAISKKMEAKIKQLDQIENNIADGLNVTNVADGALNEVSEMLIRIEELSIQAANGTYSAEDKEIIREEILILYDEMDRIFKSTNFNNISLFDYPLDVDNYDVNNESIVGPIDPVELPDSEIGILTGSTNFDMSLEAEKPTAVMTVDSHYVDNFNDLLDTKLTVSGTEYTITSSHISGATSIQDVFDKLANSISLVDSIVYDPSQSSNNVTFTLITQPVTDYNFDKTIDGLAIKDNYIDGTVNNGKEISSVTLKEVFPIDDLTNREHTTNGNSKWSGDFTLVNATDYNATISNDDLEKLGYTNLTMLGTTISIGDLFNTNNITTYGELQDCIYTELQNIVDSLPVSAGAQLTVNSGSFSIQIEDSSGINTNSFTTSSTKPSEPGDSVTIPSLPGLNTQVDNSNVELGGIVELTFPDSFNVTTDDFSITVNGTNYFFFTEDSVNYDPTSSSNTNILISNDVDIDEFIRETILAKITGSNSDGILIEPINANSYKISSMFAGGSVNVNISTNAQTTTGPATTFPPSSVISTSGSTFSSEYVMETGILDTIGGGFDLSQLNNTGFELNGEWFEFNDGSGDFVQSKTGSTVINISSASTPDELNTLISAALTSNSNLLNAYSAIDNGQIKFYYTASTKTEFENGFKYVGAFTAIDDIDNKSTAIADGGTTETQPKTTLDFSSYTAENILDLVGTGFRIYCASCPEEYINILFTYEEDIDPSDPTYSYEITTESGDKETILTYTVPISGIRDGASLVEAVAAKLDSTVLTHTIEVVVGDPNTTLVAQDKRVGNYYDENGELSQAYIVSGVITNFEYNVDIDIAIPPQTSEGGAYEVDSENIEIFVATQPTLDPYISLRLPHLNVAFFSFVPPNPLLDTAENCMKNLDLTKSAALTISKCRALIGADRNRLEKAMNETTNSNEQAQTALSVIKDTDMAKEMIEYTKMGILTQSAQSMLAHSNSNLENALGLLG